MNKSRHLAAIAGLIVLSASIATAAAGAADEAYRQWYDIRKADPKAAMSLATGYLRDYPNADNAAFMRKWLADTRAREFASAKRSHDVDEMVRLTREAVSSEGLRALDFLIFTSFEIRERELFHAPPRFDHGDVAVEFASKAIDQIQSGFVPPSASGPGWTRGGTMALLDQTIGIVDAHAGRSEKAIERFELAAGLDPKNAYNHYALGAIYRDEFDRDLHRLEAAQSEPSGGGDDAEAIRRRMNPTADRLIKESARFLALSAKRKDFAQHRSQVKANLEQVYHFRHPDQALDLGRLVSQSGGSGP